jgi:hypothetical protein
MKTTVFKFIGAIAICLFAQFIFLLFLVNPSKISSILFLSLLGFGGIGLIYQGIRGLIYQDMLLLGRGHIPSSRIKNRTAIFFGALSFLLV